MQMKKGGYRIGDARTFGNKFRDVIFYLIL